MTSYYEIEDDYLPTSPRVELQAFDNYQIYDIYCVDVTKERYGDNLINNYLNNTYDTTPAQSIDIDTVKGVNLLAVQAYNIMPILCNFNAIIQAHL